MRSLLPFLVLAAACSTPPAPITLDEYSAMVTKIQCTAIFACCDADRIAQTKSQYSDVASCIAAQSPMTLPANVRFDGAAAASCVERLKSDFGACKSSLTQAGGLEGCSNVFVGTVVEGATCDLYDGDTCAPGLACSGYGAGNTCRKVVGVGATCGNGATCAPDLTCNDSMICVAQHDVGGSCTENEDCQNLACGGSDSTCQPVPDDFWICFYDPS